MPSVESLAKRLGELTYSWCNCLGQLPSALYQPEELLWAKVYPIFVGVSADGHGQGNNADARF